MRPLDQQLIYAVLHSRDLQHITSLLEAGARPDAVVVFYPSPGREKKTTALHVAAGLGRPPHNPPYALRSAILKALLRYTRTVDRRDEDRFTPLHIAASKSMGYDAGDESPNGSQQDDPGGTCVRLLLKAGANVNARTAEEETPLHRAFDLMWHYQNKAIVKALIDAGASLNLKNLDGQTPLHKAAIESNLEVLRVLIRGVSPGKISINARDAEGMTPLHRLIESMMLWTDGGQNSMNTKHRIATNNSEVLKFIDVFLEAGANPTIKDSSGKTPLDYFPWPKSRKQLLTWPAERTLRRAAANTALRPLPNDVRKRIFSATGLFDLNEAGRVRHHKRRRNSNDKSSSKRQRLS